MNTINQYNIDAATWLTPAQHELSPNCNERPVAAEISLLVIHNISLPPGQFSGPAVEQLFLNKLDFTQHPYFASLENLKVSSHLFIRREGEVIQFVPFALRAWHAGVSSFQGVSNCNDYSIGIELEGADDQAFTDIQYQVLSAVSAVILKRYPAIDLTRIVGHSDIAPGRKTDPGPFFDWKRFRYSLIKDVQAYE